MARWQDVDDTEPEFAKLVTERFDAHRHKTLATLRRDGSPRISGIEASFGDGNLWLGMMEGSRKAHDLRRDPRLALHSGSDDPGEDGSGWLGDAKVSGRAAEITDADEVTAALRAMGSTGDPGGMHLFRVDVEEVVLTRLGDPADHIVVELWKPDAPLRRFRRE